MGLPKRTKERLITGLKRFIPITLQQKARDVSEADTVTLVTDMLSEIFGYDKYTELTGEYAIRGTYCDLAIKLEGKLTLLIEVKAIGTTLDDRHTKQAVDYAANQGVEWVILTNAVTWRLYNVIFSKPIDTRQIAEFEIPEIEYRKEQHLEMIYPITKEGFKKGAHIALRDRQDATSRYILAALLTENPNVVAAIRRELRRTVDVLVDEEEIVSVLKSEVLKRETLEGEEAQAATKKVNRKESKAIVDSKPATKSREPETPSQSPAIVGSDPPKEPTL